MENKYIGIENEITSFSNGELVKPGQFFGRFCKEEEYRGNSNIRRSSKNSVRSLEGVNYYVEGTAWEMCTPPIEINKGFSSRLTDILMIARDRVVNTFPEYKHTGYSMHWNLSKINDMNTSLIYNDLCVPFHIFGLTPLSCGLNFRIKDNKERYEFLGDSINNEDQINAMALLLGSYFMTMENGVRNNFLPNLDLSSGEKLNLIFPNGRYSAVPVICDGRSYEIGVQQYLEMFYKSIEQAVEIFGTREEVKNLKDFIFREKFLEFDKFKHYSRIHSMQKDSKIAFPLEVQDSSGSGPILRSSGKTRKLPLEGRVWGEIVRQKRDSICQFEWDSLSIREDNHTEKYEGIEQICNYSRSLNPLLDKLESIPLSSLKLSPIRVSIKKSSFLKYNPEEDKSDISFDISPDSWIKKMRKRLSSINPSNLAIKTAFYSGVTGIIFSLVSMGMEFYNQYSLKAEIQNQLNNFGTVEVQNE